MMVPGRRFRSLAKFEQNYETYDPAPGVALQKQHPILHAGRSISANGSVY